MTQRARTGLEVAIVGMAGRFPGAPDLERFWESLRSGRESITRFSDAELIEAGVDPELVGDGRYVKARPVLDDADRFDARLFGISPREAELLDPQHRLFLECSWLALEDAGRAGEADAQRTGVFGGTCINTYLTHLVGRLGGSESAGRLQALMGNDKDYLATRVSYKLGLEGPSMTVQTACSTSLVAVHLAGQSLLTGECDLAIAGGVTVRVPQRVGYLYQEGEIFSPDGHCRTFDADGAGTVFGSGVGVVVLKRLADAERDRDRVRAVILGSAVNNDGSRKVGYSAPRVETQARVISSAHRMADVDPWTIDYVEAHGTATPLGDPIEIEALKRAFGDGRTDRRCWLGSVKTNVGHLETAAGVAGLVKTVLALEHRTLPPSLHFRRPNPSIQLDATPFRVVDRLTEWRRGEAPRRAGVSSFGIGGTNAHVVLEEAPPAPPSGPARSWQLLRLSARTRSALDASAAALTRRLEGASSRELSDCAYTLWTGRRILPHRRAVVCSDADGACRALEGSDAAGAAEGFAEDLDRPVLFLFPGQGSQHPDMGRRLWEEEPTFREWIDRCSERLVPELGLDLREVLYPEPAERERAAARLSETAVAQPALFTVELALAKLWSEWGVEPRALAGHSVGEYVAACLAGVFGYEDGLWLMAERGRLMQETARGAMVAVPLPEEEVVAALGPDLDLAAVNGPSLCVVSGPADAVERLERELESRGVRCRRLETSHSFHSRSMEPAAERFARVVGAVDLEPPRIPMVSNVTGRWLTPEEATSPDYWVRHLRRTVRFGECLDRLFEESGAVLLEVGPSQALTTLVKRSPRRPDGLLPLASLPHAAADRDALRHLLGTLGRLWCAGGGCGAKGPFARQERRTVQVPTYPLERERYWIDPEDRGAAGSDSPGADPGDARSVDDREIRPWVPSWRRVPGSPAPAVGGADSAGSAGPWLVFLDAAGLGAALVERLRALGRTVVTVTYGTRGESHADDAGAEAFTVRPGREEDVDRVVDTLEARGDGPSRVVHLGSVGADAREGSLERGFFDLFYLARALGRAKRDDPVDLHVVSTGIYDVTGEERLVPENGALPGLCRVVSQELARLRCRVVDVSLPEATLGPHRGLDALAGRLVAELTSAVPVDGGGGPRPVAFRGAHRWVGSLERVDLEAAGPLAAALGPAPVVLITGGLGGLGLTFARHLGREAGARLVLVGRGELPPRQAWGDWLEERPEDDPASRKLRAVRELESAGIEVLVERADVSRPEELAGVVERARERFGGIDVVIHAAGVAGGGLLQLRRREAVEDVLRPKIGGARALEEVLADDPPRLLVLCSSTIGLRGGVGQADYAAANSFLDTFAPYYAARYGTDAISVDWDGWGTVGMAAAAPSPGAAATAGHPLLGSPAPSSGGRAVHAVRVAPETSWTLGEHRVLARPTMPGTAYLEMARAAAGPARDRVVELREVVFRAPLVVPEGSEAEVRTERTQVDGGFRVVIAGRGADATGSWREHAEARVTLAASVARERRSLDAIRSRCPREIVHGDRGGGDRLVAWGPRWSCLEEAFWDGRGEGLARLVLPERFRADLDDLVLHPALMDVAGSFLLDGLDHGAVLPYRYDLVRVHGPLPEAVYSHARVRTDSDDQSLRLDVDVLSPDGEPVVEIRGFTLRKLQQRKAEEPRPVSGGPVPGRSGRPATLIDPARGADLLGRIVARRPGAQVIVAAGDPMKAPGLEPRRESPEVGAPAADRGGESRHARPELETPFTEPRNDLEVLLASLWGAVLGIDRVGVHDNFFDLGGDSILGLQLLSRARDAGLELEGDQLFSHQTVAELAEVARWRDAPSDGGVRPEGEEPPRAVAQESFGVDLGDDELDEILTQLGGD